MVQPHSPAKLVGFFLLARLCPSHPTEVGPYLCREPGFSSTPDCWIPCDRSPPRLRDTPGTRFPSPGCTVRSGGPDAYQPLQPQGTWLRDAVGATDIPAQAHPPSPLPPGNQVPPWPLVGLPPASWWLCCVDSLWPRAWCCQSCLSSGATGAGRRVSGWGLTGVRGNGAGTASASGKMARNQRARRWGNL